MNAHLLAFDSDMTDASSPLMRRRYERASWPSLSPSAEPAVHRKPRAHIPGLMLATIIRGPTRRFDLKKTLPLELKQEDGIVVVRHSALPVLGCGETAQAAVQAFYDMFEAQWIGLVESDEPLAPDAEAAKRLLLAVATPAG